MKATAAAQVVPLGGYFQRDAYAYLRQVDLGEDAVGQHLEARI